MLCYLYFHRRLTLVADMSSDFLSRPVEVSKHGLIFAGAQKNSGIAGLAVVIIREDLVKKPRQDTPVVMDYKIFSESNSLYNTPPTFSIYIAGLVYEWLLAQGGLEAMERRNIEKSNKVYEAVDASNGFYTCPVEKSCRSRMNIPIRITVARNQLPAASLEAAFSKEAAAMGLVELAGHRSVGGIRVSLYNAMPLEGVEALVKFMHEFHQHNSKSEST